MMHRLALPPSRNRFAKTPFILMFIEGMGFTLLFVKDQIGLMLKGFRKKQLETNDYTPETNDFLLFKNDTCYTYFSRFCLFFTCIFHLDKKIYET